MEPESPDTANPRTGKATSAPPHAASPFLDRVSILLARGSLSEQGSAAVWFRADAPIIEGVVTSPLMRAALTADFCNGTSAPLDIRDWTFVNGDLSLGLTRMPIGDWILLDAQTSLGPGGRGLTYARLADETGYFGQAMQSLVIEPREPQRKDT